MRLARHAATGAEGARFALSGLAVALYYIVATLALKAVMPFQAALVAGYSSAVALHFTLQRRFVWARRGEFALALRHQLWLYLAVAVAQYAVTAAITATLPPALEVPVTVVYVVTAIGVAAANFFVFRHRIFHPAAAAGSGGNTPITTRR